MKILNTILGIVMAGSCIAQVNTTILNHNNTSGIISDHGFFFNNPTNSSPGYEVPSGSGSHAIYSGAFWFKGENINGFRYLIAPDLFGNSFDLKPGPCGGNGVSFYDPNPLNETMWTVSKVEIENHILNFDQPGYVIPSTIQNWPAHGDTSAGYSFYLAPFTDVNLNGLYEPSLGDYPCIKGDKATYTIMNDLKEFGLPMRLEIHYMFYQFHSGGFLDNTTFIDIDVYNRGVTHFYDFKMSFVQDGDLGNPFDDFYGCDSSANLIYSYNGDSMDENFGGIQGYGLNAPSVGTICLSHDIESAMSFTDIWWAPDAFPASEQEKWNVMDGVWAGGANITDDNGQVTKFQYPGNPNNLNEWSELGSGNQPGNRKSMMTVSDGIVLEPLYGHKTYTCAIVYNRSGNSEVENVNGLLAVADSVQGFYDLYLESQCNPSIMSVSEHESLDFQMYPNPSNGSLNIDLMGNEKYSVSILDMTGRIMYTSAIEKNKVVLDLDLPSGVFLVQVETGNSLATKKLIID